MADICTDNRFELIEKYKKELIEATNIESAQDEMAVLDDLLFRFWQMGWLDKLEQTERKMGEWEEIEVIPEAYDIAGVKTWASKMRCNQCGFTTFAIEGKFAQYDYCPHCGAKMEI